MPRDQRLFMTFPIDFWTHPKVTRLSDAAFRAFVEANGHSRMRETDGVLEADDAEFLWKPEVLSELVNSHPSRPLLVRLESGEYVLRDYAEHQFTKADRDELSRKRSEAGRLGGKARASAKQVLSNPEQTEAGIEIGKEIEEEKIKNSSSELADASPRHDTIYLCTLLADLIEGNGSKRPTVTKAWLDAARLMFDKDGRELERAERLLRWTQANEFWRANVLSMPKFREKYDQLRLQAEKERQGSAPKLSNAQRALSLVDHYARLEGVGELTA